MKWEKELKHGAYFMEEICKSVNPCLKEQIDTIWTNHTCNNIVFLLISLSWMATKNSIAIAVLLLSVENWAPRHISIRLLGASKIHRGATKRSFQVNYASIPRAMKTNTTKKSNNWIFAQWREHLQRNFRKSSFLDRDAKITQMLASTRPEQLGCSTCFDHVVFVFHMSKCLQLRA